METMPRWSRRDQEPRQLCTPIEKLLRTIHAIATPIHDIPEEDCGSSFHGDQRKGLFCHFQHRISYQEVRCGEEARGMASPH